MKRMSRPSFLNVLLSAVVLVLVAACQPAAQPGVAESSSGKAVPPPAAPVVRQSAPSETPASAPAPAAPRPEAATASGAQASTAAVQSVGEKLRGLPLVKLAELAANPSAHAGKKVRVEGTVVSYCFHSRNWFAVKAADGSGPAVRILTGPSFLVPEKCTGRQARAEGTVEVVEVSATSARHYAESHGLADPSTVKGTQPVKQVVIRATGAEFI